MTKLEALPLFRRFLAVVVVALALPPVAVALAVRSARRKAWAGRLVREAAARKAPRG